MQYYDSNSSYDIDLEKPKPKQKRRTWLWVLGWIIFFPIPLSILLVRSKRINSKVKYILFAVLWMMVGAFIFADTDSQQSESTDKSISIETTENISEESDVQPTISKQVKEKVEESEQAILEAEQAENERLEAERAEQERIAAEKAEQERIAAEKAEQERIAAEQVERERERIAAEKAEQERVANERAEQERIAAMQSNNQRSIPASEWVLNTHTMKIHHPDCPDVQRIKDENYYEYNGLLDDLFAEGYTECGHCFGS